jgi:phage terminase large subunit
MNLLEAFIPALRSQHRYLILVGGAGSGKSIFASQKILHRCDTVVGHRFLIVRKVAKTIRPTIFQTVLDVASGGNFPVQVNKTEMHIRFLGAAKKQGQKGGDDNVKSEIISAGLDDVEKVKSIAGITGLLIEEATDITEADFDQLDLRLRGDTPEYKQIILCLNPISHRHWIKRKFIKAGTNAEPIDPSNTFVLHTTFMDNPFVREEYEAVLGRLSPKMKQIYMEGTWGEDLAGLVYPNNHTKLIEGDGTDLSWKHVHTLDQPDCYGLDFGFNDPNVLVALHFSREPKDPRETETGQPPENKKEVLVSKEIYRSKSTVEDLARSMIARGISKHVPIYADPSRPDAIESLQRYGFNVQKAFNPIEDGIDMVHQYHLFYHEDFTEMEEELYSYKWKPKKNDEEKHKDEPIDDFNHVMDAIRYAIATHVLTPELQIF